MRLPSFKDIIAKLPTIKEVIGNLTGTPRTAKPITPRSLGSFGIHPTPTRPGSPQLETITDPDYSPYLKKGDPQSPTLRMVSAINNMPVTRGRFLSAKAASQLITSYDKAFAFQHDDHYRYIAVPKPNYTSEPCYSVFPVATPKKTINYKTYPNGADWTMATVKKHIVQCQSVLVFEVPPAIQLPSLPPRPAAPADPRLANAAYFLVIKDMVDAELKAHPLPKALSPSLGKSYDPFEL
jgi:hypothetical protein